MYTLDKTEQQNDYIRTKQLCAKVAQQTFMDE